MSASIRCDTSGNVLADNSRALAQRLSSFFVLTVRRRWLLLELRAVEHAGEQH
nr:hypothetical protein [Pseudomonas sp. DNDY-54]